MSVSASFALLAGALGHFNGHMSSVRTVGALGVTLKWVGLVDYLRCFEKTGATRRHIFERLLQI